MTKSVVATLAGIAIDQAKLRTDQRVLEFFPERTFLNIDDRKRRLTVEHLLTMTSGICSDPYYPKIKPTDNRREPMASRVDSADD